MKPGANPAPKTVAIDFDGVLADYHGWKEKDVLDPPAPGALKFVKRALAEGYRVVVHTTRRPSRIEGWLAVWGFPPEITVTNDKPMAMVYIDDRGFRFDGDWDAAFDAIETPPHWKEEEPDA